MAPRVRYVGPPGMRNNVLGAANPDKGPRLQHGGVYDVKASVSKTAAEVFEELLGSELFTDAAPARKKDEESES